MTKFQAQSAGRDDTPSVSSSPSRPLHHRFGSLCLVFIGGAAGTSSRVALSLFFSSSGTFPMTIFFINIAGAFLLGVLLESLSRSGKDQGWRQRSRLMIGTGYLGGFTTYSTLATDSALLLTKGMTNTMLVYALGTVLVGAVATFLGILCGSKITNTKGIRKAK